MSDATPVPIVVDALSARPGGGLSYLSNQLQAIERVDPARPLTILAAPENADALRAQLVAPIDVVRSGALRPLVELVALRFLASRSERRHRGDRDGNQAGVLYCPGNFAPLVRGRRPVVLTLQNPNYFGSGRRADHNRSIDRRVRSALSRRSTRAASRVVVISRALRDELALDEPDVAARAVLVPSGAPTWPDRARRPSALTEHIGDDDGFVLILANDAPHKQLDLAATAWSDAMTGQPSDGDEPTGVLPLVVAGRFFDDTRPDAVRQLVTPQLRAHLHLLGAVEGRDEVWWLLEHATVMVAAASREAHPLTPAEAGSLGCPLLLSDIAAHREVAGDHARFVRAGSRSELADALRGARDEPGSVARSRWTWPVSWDDNARALLAVIDEVAR